MTRLATIAAMLESGATRQAIADRLGVSPRTVGRAIAATPELAAVWQARTAARAALAATRRRLVGARPTAAQRAARNEDLDDLAAHGCTRDEAADRLGMTVDSLSRWLQRNRPDLVAELPRAATRQ